MRTFVQVRALEDNRSSIARKQASRWAAGTSTSCVTATTASLRELWRDLLQQPDHLDVQLDGAELRLEEVLQIAVKLQPRVQNSFVLR